jgi:Phage tail lysozyme
MSSLSDRQKELANIHMAGNPQLGIPPLPLISACAAVGNATQENQVRPVTTGPKDHGSDGLFQWRGARLNKLKQWAAGNGLSWDTMETQAWFFVYEMQSDRAYKVLYGELLAGTKPSQTITADICRLYERPNASKANLQGRVKATSDTYAAMPRYEDSVYPTHNHPDRPHRPRSAETPAPPCR